MSEWKLSEQKVAANRANAQHSTGPRTDSGKARAAQNARTHGLTARELVIRPEERQDFDRLLADYRDNLKPAGPLEETVFAQIVHATWNLRRVRLLEAELFDGITDPLALEQNEAKLDRLSRYAQRFERSLYRATAELRRLQTERAARLFIPDFQAGAIAPLASLEKLEVLKRTQGSAETEFIRSQLARMDWNVAQMSGCFPAGGIIPSLLPDGVEAAAAARLNP